MKEENEIGVEQKDMQNAIKCVKKRGKHAMIEVRWKVKM